eukprot:GHVT01067529.1.p1 GENE.GHVT01067529.1~~GHVT01067529.1.p1  ORF type:complete len:252 (+),score=30.70 GHVT01067529.1:2343-3098(+)
MPTTSADEIWRLPSAAICMRCLRVGFGPGDEDTGQDEQQIVENLVEDCQIKLDGLVTSFKQSLSKVHCEFANPGLLRDVSVDIGGKKVLLRCAATVSVSTRSALLVEPHEARHLPAVESVLSKSDLGFSISHSTASSLETHGGRQKIALRLTLPPMTEELRITLSKRVQRAMEEAKVLCRNVRQKTLSALKALEKSKRISTDHLRRVTDQVQRAIEDRTKQMQAAADLKGVEILRSGQQTSRPRGGPSGSF